MSQNAAKKRTGYCQQCGLALLDRRIEGKDYLACPDRQCGFVFWNNPIPVVTVIVEFEGAILLARNHRWPAGMYSVISGFIEHGESPEETVKREVKEELGLDTETLELIGVYGWKEANQTLLAYRARCQGSVALSDELIDVKHIPPTRLKSWKGGAGDAVRDYIQRFVADN